MEHRVKGRAYDGSRRRTGSADRRRRILQASHDLFLSRGYLATTMASVAANASVSIDTVYELVGRKPTLLRELVEEAISGADHPMDAEERAYVKEMAAETDPRAKLEIYTRALRRIHERLAPLFLVLRDASPAAPEALGAWDDVSRRRAKNMRKLVRDLVAAGGLRPGVSVEDTADVVWLMNSPDVYVMLTCERGWSPRRYERWLCEALELLLLA